MRPEARTEHVMSQPLGDELVVYDIERRQYHHLNATAALVWRNCDGQRSVEELSVLVREIISQEAGDETVWSALLLLQEANLLTEPGLPEDSSSPTRREFLSRAARTGGRALFAATVATVAAPAVAQAQSSACPPEPAACLRW